MEDDATMFGPSRVVMEVPVVALLFAVLLAALVPPSAFAQGGGNAQGPPPAPVVVATAESHVLAPVTWYPGTVISRNQARVAAEVDGRLEWVAEVGAAIAEGDLVARMDDALLRQSLAENEAAVARENARLIFLDAQVERLERLVTQNTATRSRLEEAVAERDISRSELSAARARVALTTERLERTRIRAPFGGIVTERVRQGGEWANSGEAVVRIVDTGAREVRAWVPIAALAFVEEGGELALQAGPGHSRATVRTIVPVGDNRSRLYELRLGVEDRSWPVGQDVRVAIPTAAARDVVAVPRDALVLRRGGTAVYRVGENGLADRVAVTPGIAQGELIEVAGIASGDRVVIRGGERLRPGQSVQVVNPEPPG
ncbi:MAG: efflux RND transporter periplasmic adaptor subunit [Thiotrichales bacterium]|nr:efflux RND transporter periplasmic adaptor subunit [Thiotrichales bacterium]